MNRRKGSIIDWHLESARESLEQSKKNYFRDAARLDKLVEKQKALQQNKLEEMFIKSDRTYDEVLAFFNVEGADAEDSDINMPDDSAEDYTTARPAEGKHCRHHTEQEKDDNYDDSENFQDNPDPLDDPVSYNDPDRTYNDGDPYAEPYDAYCDSIVCDEPEVIAAEKKTQNRSVSVDIMIWKKHRPLEIILFFLIIIITVVLLLYTTITTLEGKNGNGNNTSPETTDVLLTFDPNSSIFLADGTSEPQTPGSAAQFQTAVIGSRQVSVADTEVDLSQLSMEEITQHLNFICSMPNLNVVYLGDNYSSLGAEGATLIRKNTNAVFKGDVQLYGKTVSLETNCLDLSFTDIADEAAQLKEVLPGMSMLSQLRMEYCGLSDETMGEIRDSVPWVKVVWRIWFGANNAYSCMTDNETILASKPSVYGALTNENTKALQYCTSTKYLDLGYNGLLTDCSFIAGMKDLEICILSNTSVDSLEPFRNCTNLKLLEVASASISDLSPLSGCNELIYLNVGMNSEITDYTPLYGLRKLKKLSVAGTINALGNVNGLENALSGTGCTILKDLSYVELNNDKYYYTAIEGEWRYDGLRNSSENWEHARKTGVADLVYSENYNYVRSAFNYDAGDKAYCTEMNGF